MCSSSLTRPSIRILGLHAKKVGNMIGFGIIHVPPIIWLWEENMAVFHLKWCFYLSFFLRKDQNHLKRVVFYGLVPSQVEFRNLSLETSCEIV
jgi:hypothetical protein